MKNPNQHPYYVDPFADNKPVLHASFLMSKDNATSATFYYHITGDQKWLQIFEEQKSKYVQHDEEGRFIYSQHWYAGKECSVCEPAHSRKLFLNDSEFRRIKQQVEEQGLLGEALVKSMPGYKNYLESIADENWLLHEKYNNPENKS